MISQSKAKRKLTYHNHTRTAKKKSYVCQHRRTQTSPKSTGRAPCLAGGSPADACSPRRRVAQAQVARRQTQPQERFNRGKVHASSQHVVQTHLRRSWPHLPWVVGSEKHVRSIKRRAQPQQKRALVAMPMLCLRACQSEAASAPLKTAFVKRPAASQKGRTGQRGQRIKSPQRSTVVRSGNRPCSAVPGAPLRRAPPASLACRARPGAFVGAVGVRHLGGRHEDGASAAPWARYE